ncbi:helix-turn-helix domain-containing protein [Salmonella enterica]|nr:helix-turn-helix domain-containing protein [Salmonella enterica]EBP2046028.1 helix-turn-helix domain-containing protein [Salmonella enterica]EBP2073054.1 helix-turn-helix domain-containing protein [Salmonella enterica]EBP2081669.1 helix-turn-helix domain-containing protein [Salmonella enterica]EBP2090766.1 helix-turn-helix domain-containing protein [Salmonella enterica]
MKEYWDSLTKEQQCKLAGNVGSTTGYLRLVFNGYKKAGFSLAKKLEEETAGEITKSDLRPDIYSKQWQSLNELVPQQKE